MTNVEVTTAFEGGMFCVREVANGERCLFTNCNYDHRIPQDFETSYRWLLDELPGVDGMVTGVALHYGIVRRSKVRRGAFMHLCLKRTYVISRMEYADIQEVP